MVIFLQFLYKIVPTQFTYNIKVHLYDPKNIAL